MLKNLCLCFSWEKRVEEFLGLKDKEMGRDPDLINNSNSFPGSSFLPVIYARNIKCDFWAVKHFLLQLWVCLYMLQNFCVLGKLLI